MQDLTPSTLLGLVGKTIRWEAPIYEGNEGHYGKGRDGGIAKIIKVDPTSRRPILESETLEGTSPMYIFNEWNQFENHTDDCLCFSDGDRYVSFEIVNPKYIYKQKEFVNTEQLRDCDVEKHLKKVESFYIAPDPTSKEHQRIVGGFFTKLQTAQDIAEEKGGVAISKGFTLGQNVRGSLIYFPKSKKWELRTTEKRRVPVIVSEAEYKEALLDIKSQKEQDRDHDWRPSNPDYYSIETWTF